MELVGQRTAAKDAKDWELADSLRARISELGFAVKDVKGGEPIISPIEQYKWYTTFHYSKTLEWRLHDRH
jgi:hypothetical protein